MKVEGNTLHIDLNKNDDKKLKEIANEYGVSPQTISSIKNNRTWSHVMV